MLYLNGEPLKVTVFPDNTSQVWKLDESMLQKAYCASIEWKFSHEGEIMHLGQLKMLLQSAGVRASLTLPYLPYGRQDKDVSNSSTFALKHFAHAINAMTFEEVVITDPHSEIALELIRGSRAVYPKEQLKEIILTTDTTLICYPDAGAVSKYSSVYHEEVGSAFIYGEKVRDQLTGRIISYNTVGKDVPGQSILIVDDICDGGATFKLLAKELLATGAASVSLFVTHGIFSKGIRTLFDSGISRVFTKDGEVTERTPFLQL